MTMGTCCIKIKIIESFNAEMPAAGVGQSLSGG